MTSRIQINVYVITNSPGEVSDEIVLDFYHILNNNSHTISQQTRHVGTMMF